MRRGILDLCRKSTCRVDDCNIRTRLLHLKLRISDPSERGWVIYFLYSCAFVLVCFFRACSIPLRISPRSGIVWGVSS